MRCPYCQGNESRVVDTTQDTTNDAIKRRRLCLLCGERFSTIERVRTSLPLIIKGGAGPAGTRREPFDHEKLRLGIQVACAKRPIPETAIDRIIDGIDARLRALNVSEVPSRAIGEMVIEALRDLDEIAYIRYAIVFLGLDDLADVRSEIDRLLSEQPKPKLYR